MKIPFMDTTIRDQGLKKELLISYEKILDHGRFILGPEVEIFEKEIAHFHQAKFAIGMSSGTDALYMIYRALNLKPNDEVIIPALSWIATANAVAVAGLTPVFCDIRDDLNMDPESVAKLITAKTKVIMPVHFMGQVCEMDPLISLAQKHNLLIIEDASQAIGAKYKGRLAGTFGFAMGMSLNPMKILGAGGEAGVVTTNDEKLFHKIVALRYNGMVNKVDCQFRSLNGRIDTVQAGFLSVKLKYMSAVIKRRKEIVGQYNEAFRGLVKCLPENPDYENTYYGYTLRIKNRNEFIKYLIEHGVETKIQHYPLMPEQPAYKEFSGDHYPKAIKIAEEIVNIPNHENLSDANVAHIIKVVKGFVS
jgi:dTDP-4-amino-4,6-dideoxygalactose transaminase